MGFLANLAIVALAVVALLGVLVLGLAWTAAGGEASLTGRQALAVGSVAVLVASTIWFAKARKRAKAPGAWEHDEFLDGPDAEDLPHDK